MSELLDIIIQAVDEASEVFQSVTSSAEDMGDEISGAVENSESDFEGMASAAEDASASVESVGEATADIDSANVQDTAEATNEFGSAAETAEGPLGEITNLLGGLAGVEVFSELSSQILELADSAGTFNDSMTRASLEAEGAGISVDTMKGSMAALSEETGRAGGQIREAFIKATARGITDMSSFETMMKGAGAQATLFGTDIESMGNKFSGLAMKSTLMERTLSETGITFQEIATAMGDSGMTADEVKEKWKELDANQRAAILGTAASLNEGKNANDEYKNSWAGLKEQVDIAKGRFERLVGEVFLPVLIPVMKVVSGVLQGLGNVISWVMSGPLGGLVSVIGSVVAVVALAIPAYMALSAAFTFLQGPAWAAAAAIWGAISPLLPFIAIGAAIVFIIYEIGKAFGWWNDVGGMIDAIGAGLQRLWDAFINHPDVQAFIKYLADGWAWLSNAIGQAWNAILQFFGVSTSGEFDIVRALIDGIGAAWNAIREPIMAVAEIIRTVLGVLADLITGHMSAEEAIMTMWNALATNIPIILQSLFNISMSLWGMIFQAGKTAVSNLVTAVWSYLSRLPGIVWQWLVSAAQRLGLALINWQTTTRNRITQMIMMIITYLSQIPGKVYSIFMNAAQRLYAAASAWVTNATTKAREVVTGAYNALVELPGKIASALGGVVDAIVKPFQDAYNKAKEIWDKIVSMASNTPSVSAAGGETAAGGESFTVNNGGMVIDHNVNVSLDLQNVPAHVSTEQLVSALTDRTVLRELTNNRDFQLLDGQAKERLNLRVNRARGV